MSFLNWAGEHPWLFLLIVLAGANVIGYCVRQLASVFKHRRCPKCSEVSK